MADQNEVQPTVPEQPEIKPPLRKGLPLIVVMVLMVGGLGLANLSSLLSGSKKAAPRSALTTRPSAPDAQQVSSFETQQQLQARRDLEDQQRQQQLAAAMQELQQEQSVPGPEAPNAPAMTPAQRAAIYGNSPNAPQHTSGLSEAQAEAKQKQLAKEKLHQDALDSDTVAIDFSHESASSSPAKPVEVAGEQAAAKDTSSAADFQPAAERKPAKADPMAPYDFDQYQGRLYRVFEGTVLEGVVTNHIDGGLSGPILVMLTTDYYSHDHQQLLMPQGTRLIGTVQSVGSQGQRKLMVSFHRAVCPDGFSLELDKYAGLDQVGTTGLATHVDNHIFSSFAAAAAIGGLGGLAQIGNSASILSPSAEIRDGISAQTSQESEQILNHFLNRLPVITVKEGSRARVYIGTDILIPSYAEHRVDPTL